MQLLSIDDPDEKQIALLISRHLERIPNAIERMHKVQGIRSKPRSEMSRDDEATAWLQLSHLVDLCLNVTADNLDVLRVMLYPDGTLTLRQTAHYPTLRAGLEASALALWLMAPADSRGRIVRLLRARTTDIRFAYLLATDAAGAVGAGTREQRSTAAKILREAARQKQGHRKQIATIAEAVGIDSAEYVDGQPGYRQLIEEATAAAGGDGGRAGLIWRIISGFTHPSALRSLHFGKTDTVRENADGTLHVLSTTSPLYVALALQTVLLNYRTASDLLAVRKIKPAAR